MQRESIRKPAERANRGKRITTVAATPRRKSRKPRGMGHQRRNEILAAARHLFMLQGYQAVTTRKLAARVGLSQTGLYVYFKDKEEILDALCRDTFAQLALKIREMQGKARSYPELLRRLIRGYIEFALEHPDEYQLSFMVQHNSPKFTGPRNLDVPFEKQGIGTQAFLLFRNHFQEMSDAGWLKPIDVTLAAQTVWVAIHGLVALLIARPGYLMGERERLIDTLSATLSDGLHNNGK